MRKWKNQFLKNATMAFDLSNATKEYKERIERLEKENEELANVKELKEGIKNFIDFYNHKRFHSALGYDRPMNVYKKMLHKVA